MSSREEGFVPVPPTSSGVPSTSMPAAAGGRRRGYRVPLLSWVYLATAGFWVFLVYPAFLRGDWTLVALYGGLILLDAFLAYGTWWESRREG